VALHSQIPSAGSDLAGISLCAGVGGLELGLHIAEPGYRTVCFVEREVSAAATLVARMEDQALSDAPVWDDLRTFDGRPWRGKVHIVSAGYPCQPFSASGRRQGKDDPRHLWPEVKRIVLESEAEWLFCENVEGHLDLGLPEVLSDIQAMGYTPKAGLFSALEVGASHLRRRIFILAHANHIPLLQPGGYRDFEQGPEMAGLPGSDGQATGDRHGGAALVDDLDAGQPDRGDTFGPETLPLFAPAPSDFAAWGQVLGRRLDLQPEFFGLDHGVAHRVERSNAAGNGVVPLAAAYAFRTLRAAFEHGAGQ
jgi:DNA (cytosine-5)-methyltransferase 1